MTRLTVALVLALAGVAMGCAARPPATGGATPSSMLRVGLVEWRIVTSSRALASGVGHLTVTNTGTTAHNLHVNGPGVRVATSRLSPGGTATLAIITRVGSSLTLTCALPGHERAGMRTSITVSRQATSIRAPDLGRDAKGKP